MENLIQLIRIGRKTSQSVCPSVLAIGNFDGVHFGHVTLISTAKKIAQQQQLPLAVMTFEPSPREFFTKDLAPIRLTSLAEKTILFRQQNVNFIYCLRFSKYFAELSPAEFVSFLAQELAVKHIVVGDDFQFGNNRSGNVQALQCLAEAYQINVTVLSPVMLDARRVSSTLVRDYLEKTNLTIVRELLNRYYFISGKVIHGEKRGRLLGFPTANVALKRQKIPLRGVYSVRCFIQDNVFFGVANIGYRPTVDGFSPSLEVHLFEFNQDIYFQRLCVEFLGFIRNEKKFQSLDELKTQIEFDVIEAKKQQQIFLASEQK